MLPSNITAEITSLIANLAAAAPLSSATKSELQALQDQAAQLLSDIENAMSAAAGNLDAADPTGFPGNMVADFLALQQSSASQASLAYAYGLVGRAAFNLAQAL